MECQKKSTRIQRTRIQYHHRSRRNNDECWRNKRHIANYFEDLFQAREGKPEFQEWTDEITTTVKTALQKANNKKQGQEPVTIKETERAIKKLKRKKSQGPDDIPNEIFLEANQETTKTLTKMINNVHEEEIIPRSWFEGNIIRLYKGKDQKGKCSNERGITLASNVGKVYERIINERVKEVTQITDAQVGGKEGSATTDHLIALKQIIQEIRNDGKTAYVIFLDVQKAYDKAWLDAILYVLNKNGVDGKNLSMVKKTRLLAHCQHSNKVHVRSNKRNQNQRQHKARWRIVSHRICNPNRRNI